MCTTWRVEPVNNSRRGFVGTLYSGFVSAGVLIKSLAVNRRAIFHKPWETRTELSPCDTFRRYKEARQQLPFNRETAHLSIKKFLSEAEISYKRQMRAPRCMLLIACTSFVSMLIILCLQRLMEV